MEIASGQERRWWGYLDTFDGLIGDKRTRATFHGTVQGIIGAGSLVCQRIASHSAVLSAAREGGQRVRRLARGESTKRSQINAKALTAVLRERGVAHLTAKEGQELWLIVDGSDLCKPRAREMPDLMKVRDLDGTLVSGYRTLNVVGITPGRRALLYHRLFSSQEGAFLSESKEVQTGLQTVGKSLEGVEAQRAVTWIMDTGFDDVAVWRTIWEQEEHVVCRLKHRERCIEYKDEKGRWVKGDMARAGQEMELVAEARAEVVVRRGRQCQAKRQEVPVEIRSAPIRLTYDTAVRREGKGEIVQQELGLIEVRLLGTQLEPWLLVTDRPVANADRAV